MCFSSSSRLVQLAQCHLYHILLAKASHMARPDSSSGRTCRRLCPFSHQPQQLNIRVISLILRKLRLRELNELV